uniref:Uncharacterized protein n=1 Tax=Tanacetum cinerariifolium TaxID=118510 RepID=A0A6L2N2T5_TANCI|nr:hypothetical protein LSAT_9X27681 [Tanacetum cinerariifolium]
MAQRSIVKKVPVAIVVALVAVTTVSAQELAPAPAPGRVRTCHWSGIFSSGFGCCSWDFFVHLSTKMAQLSIMKKALVIVVVTLVAAATMSVQNFTPVPAPLLEIGAAFSALASGVMIGTS